MDTQLGKDLVLLANNKAAIKAAIEAKSVTVGSIPLSGYASKIASISGGEVVSNSTWKPNDTWFDIKKILTDDVQAGFTYKMIELIPDDAPNVDMAGGAAYKTSDGGYFTSGGSHTWNKTQDKQCTIDGQNAYKTRWLITYFSSASLNIGTYGVIKENTMMVVFSGLSITGTFQGKLQLVAIDFINSANYGGTSFANKFLYCSALEYLPAGNTSAMTTFENAFGFCGRLRTIPAFNMTANKTLSAFLEGATGIRSLPPLITTSLTTFAPTIDANLLYCGGFINLALSATFNGGWLGHDSLVNIINNLATVSGKTLTLGSWHLSLLSTAEKAVATGKGWTLA